LYHTVDPEHKRKIIGDTFMRVTQQEIEINDIDFDQCFIAQVSDISKSKFQKTPKYPGQIQVKGRLLFSTFICRNMIHDSSIQKNSSCVKFHLGRIDFYVYVQFISSSFLVLL
jgi:hypothetical protein